MQQLCDIITLGAEPVDARGIDGGEAQRDREDHRRADAPRVRREYLEVDPQVARVRLVTSSLSDSSYDTLHHES